MSPVQTTDPDSREFWDAVSRGCLPLRRCRRCARTFVLPLPSCPFCATDAPELIESTGRGRLYSWIVVHVSFDDAFTGELPYCVAAVQLDEGARVYGRLERLPFDQLCVDLEVERVASTEAPAPLMFRPRESGSSG